MLPRVPREKKSPRRRATYDDLLHVPDHLVAELIGGELFTSPRPARRHSAVSQALAGILTPRFHFRDSVPGGWYLLPEPELRFRQDVLVPDAAGWRRERLALDEDSYPAVAPDWVCEVLSPSTERLDRTKKLVIYARARVAHAWFIDPGLRTVEVMSLTGTRWTVQALHRHHDRIRAPPFDAVTIRLSDLWDEVPAQG